MFKDIGNESQHSKDKEYALSNIFKLWFIAEDMHEIHSNDIEVEECLESLRDALTEQQSTIARQVLLIPATHLHHILGKLELWRSAYGPPSDDDLEIDGDVYSLMVVSAIEDLQRFISRDEDELKEKLLEIA